MLPIGPAQADKQKPPHAETLFQIKASQNVSSLKMRTEINIKCWQFHNNENDIDETDVI